MLYEDILRKCEQYHRQYADYDKAYNKYFCERDDSQWDNPDTLTESEVRKLIDFLDEFLAFGKYKIGKTSPSDLLPALRDTVPILNLLRGNSILGLPLSSKTILDLPLSSKATQTNRVEMSLELFNMTQILVCFEELAEFSDYYYSTAASKILHTINPNLFVMWDRKIRKCRKVSGMGLGREYVHVFLLKMQRIADEAIKQVEAQEGLSREVAIKCFTEHCKYNNSLAKIIDEYNFVISR